MAKDDADKTTDLTLLSSPDSTGSPTLVQITTYIREDQAFALEILENAEQKREGKDFARAKLIQEALDLLIEKQIAIIDLRKNKLVEKSG